MVPFSFGCLLRQQWLLAVLALGCLAPRGVSGRSLRHAVDSANLSFSAVPGVTPGIFTVRGNATSQTKRDDRPPRVYFLMLAVDKVSNMAVWTEFFRQAPAGQYRAYVHCKMPSCNQGVAGSPLVAVPTVSSYYCQDLVSPMNQLLTHALRGDGDGGVNSMDKFVFVSDSTLPAKSFATIYQTLVSRPGSDFCAFPPNEWADIAGQGGLQMAIKTHQWMVLTREHAERASLLWGSGTLHDFMNHFAVNHHTYAWGPGNNYGDGHNFGCLDEFWFMAALYGTLSHVDPHRDAVVNLGSFTNAPLLVSRTAGWQGQCDTFVMWSPYINLQGRNPFAEFYRMLDQSSVPHGGNTQRPGWWDRISRHGINAIRQSSFLFVRKFTDSPTLADGGHFATEYTRIVLGS